MKIEEYGVNVVATFHDIRKQGYNKPVTSSYLLKGFIDSIPSLPLVRGGFSFMKHEYFQVYCTIGFKSGVYFSSMPQAAVYRPTTRNAPPPPIFRYVKANGAISPMYGSIGFTNKSEYIAFLNALTEFVANLSSYVK